MLMKHKLWTSLAIVAVIGGGVSWKYYHKPTQPLRYVASPVTRGTLINAISGSGQVSGQNQLELKPLVSGNITKILVMPGQNVSSTTPLFEIDTKDAQKSVRDAAQSVSDARISLASAQLSLKKLQQPADTVALTQAENTLNQAKRALQTLQKGADIYDIQQAEASLSALQADVAISADGKTPNIIRDVYDDTVPILKTIAQTLQQAIYDADSVLGIDNTGANDAFEKQLSVTDSSKLAKANTLYPLAKQAVNAFKQRADALPATGSDTIVIDAALSQAQISLDSVGPLLQNVYDALLNTVASPTFSQSSLSSLQGTIQSDRSNVSSRSTSIVTQTQSIAEAKTAYTNAQLNVKKSQASLDKLKQGASSEDLASAQERITEAEKSLAKLKAGADTIDVQLSQNSIQQRVSALSEAEHKLADAKQTLANYTVRAPFNGMIANIAAQVGTQASASTALATLLTPEKLAVISLNEVDATKIRVGQQATLTFDAIPNLTIAGSVYEVDPLGVVSQGVVNYSVKVAFETQDDRVKSGMSVSVSIITDIKTDVLLIPNAAVTTRNEASTVQILSVTGVEAAAAESSQGVTPLTPPEARVIQVGASNDTSTEVVNGLQENDMVVTRTIDPNTTAQATTNSSLRLPGITSGGGLGGGGNFGAARPAGR